MGEITCTVKHGDDLQELLIIENAVDEAVALVEDSGGSCRSDRFPGGISGRPC